MILVLIGGGNSSGKATYSEVIKRRLLGDAPGLKIREINLEEEYYNQEIPFNLEKYEFGRLLSDVEALDDDVIIVHGVYVLQSKELRLKASLKMFIDCDNDTRLTRFIKKNSPVSKERLAELIALHLQTRSALIGRVESDIVIKTDAIDDSKNKISIDLIINYLLELLDNDDGVNLDKGEINLRENVERFYELN